MSGLERIRLTRPWAGKPRGAVVEVDPVRARAMIDDNRAEPEEATEARRRPAKRKG